MNYYITPPVYYPNAPRIVRKFFYRALMKWADREHLTAFNLAIKSGDYKLSRILSREWSGMRVLATHPHFHWFCGQLYQDPKTWNSLGKDVRDFFCRALELYEGLRDTKVN